MSRETHWDETIETLPRPQLIGVSDRSCANTWNWLGWSRRSTEQAFTQPE